MAKRTAEATSAIDLLKADHEDLRKALTQLEKATGSERRKLSLARAKALIVLHAKGEEAIFYPAFHDVARTKEDQKLFFEAHEEHHLVDFVISELEAAPAEGEVFAAKAKVLKDVVEHHAEEEEQQMLPRARKLLDRASLIELGTRLRQFKRMATAEDRSPAPRRRRDPETRDGELRI